MPRRKRSDISLAEIVQRIDDEPLKMSRRLDFADWLERHGCQRRARWVRRCCSICDALSPLLMGQGAEQGLTRSTEWGLADLSGSGIDRWQSIQPDYWSEISGVTQTPYFGRFVLGSQSEHQDVFRRIGDTPWLPRASEEGWLESISHVSANAEQLRDLVAWPASHRTIALHVDLDCSSLDGADNGLIRDVIQMEGLQGLALSPHAFRFSSMKTFGEVSPNFKYLQLRGLRSTGASLRILEQLQHLTQLRSLLVGPNLPDNSSLSLLTRIPNLQTLRLYALKVTDAGLPKLQAMKSLRVVAIDLADVSRTGIDALRKLRPDLQVIVQGRLRERIGPA